MPDLTKMFAGLVCVVYLALLAGCASDIFQESGMSNFRGWNLQPYESIRSGAEVDGQDGHLISVYGPSGKCLPSRSWTGRTRHISGSFPPGVHFGGDKSWDITGIPTERGHWVVKLELYNVECGALHYDGFQQELRFHITGSGKVVQ